MIVTKPSRIFCWASSGRLPLGFPDDWVYQSAFGADWKNAIASRTEVSPLENLAPVDMEVERAELARLLKRDPTDEEFVMYLNHPADAIKTIEFQKKFGNPNHLPLDVWFEGIKPGQTLNFNTTSGKPHQMLLLSIDPVNDDGVATVRYVLDSEILTSEVQIDAPVTAAGGGSGSVIAESGNQYHVASPRKADLWIVHVKEGDIVKQGQELFNVSIMKQERSVLAPVNGIVKRVVKTADFKKDHRMVPVLEGELIVELSPVPKLCPKCSYPITDEHAKFCPFCGTEVSSES